MVEDGHEFVTGLLDSGVITEADVVRIDGRLAFADAVAASDPDGGGPRLYFQRVPEPKTAKNRVHVDLAIAPGGDPEAAIARLVELGATRVADKEKWGHAWTVLQDPEGNEFCVSRVT